MKRKNKDFRSKFRFQGHPPHANQCVKFNCLNANLIRKFNLKKSITRLIILPCLLVITLNSCSPNVVAPSLAENNYMDPTMYSMMMSIPEGERDFVIEKRKSATILGEYVSIDNHTYILEINKKEAAKLGVRDTVYNIIVEEIDQTNKIVADLMAKGDTIRMPDIKAHLKRYREDPEIQYKSETFRSNRSMTRSKPIICSGLIETSDNYPEYDSFHVAEKMTAVDFFCLSKSAMFSTVICSITVLGNTRYDTAIVPLGCNRLIQLPIDASGNNVSAKISFKTTDPRGGRCSWKAY